MIRCDQGLQLTLLVLCVHRSISEILKAKHIKHAIFIMILSTFAFDRIQMFSYHQTDKQIAVFTYLMSSDLYIFRLLC